MAFLHNTTLSLLLQMTLTLEVIIASERKMRSGDPTLVLTVQTHGGRLTGNKTQYRGCGVDLPFHDKEYEDDFSRDDLARFLHEYENEAVRSLSIFVEYPLRPHPDAQLRPYKCDCRLFSLESQLPRNPHRPEPYIEVTPPRDPAVRVDMRQWTNRHADHPEFSVRDFAPSYVEISGIRRELEIKRDSITITTGNGHFFLRCARSRDSREDDDRSTSKRPRTSTRTFTAQPITDSLTTQPITTDFTSQPIRSTDTSPPRTHPNEHDSRERTRNNGPVTTTDHLVQDTGKSSQTPDSFNTEIILAILSVLFIFLIFAIIGIIVYRKCKIKAREEKRFRTRGHSESRLTGSVISEPEASLYESLGISRRNSYAGLSNNAYAEIDDKSSTHSIASASDISCGTTNSDVIHTSSQSRAISRDRALSNVYVIPPTPPPLGNRLRANHMLDGDVHYNRSLNSEYADFTHTCAPYEYIRDNSALSSDITGGGMCTIANNDTDNKDSTTYSEIHNYITILPDEGTSHVTPL